MITENKVAIITGASSGIGKAVATRLNKAGVKLIITARREFLLQELANRLSQTVIIPGDITDQQMPQLLIDEALKIFGRCDIVVNNAGIMTGGTIEDIDIEETCKMVRTNVEAAFRMSYAALKYFKKIGRGYLLMVSSILGTKVRAEFGAYAATKYAIEALTEALRIELAKTNISITAIEPGLVSTELHKHLKVHPKESMDISRPLEPEEVAEVVYYLIGQPNHIRIPRILIMPADHSF